jgi:hypothetical protein
MRVLQPLVDSISQALKDNYDSFSSLIRFFIPRHQIAGFSCYLCEKCLGVETPLPIKDLGFDLTRGASQIK